jgi:hypothetical protein
MSLALVCINALGDKSGRHTRPAIVEPSPAGGHRAACPTCDHKWHLTEREAWALGLGEKGSRSERISATAEAAQPNGEVVQ